MFGPLLVILGENEFLPKNYDDSSILAKVEELFDKCFETENFGPIERINKLFGIDPVDLSDNLSEDIGPKCPSINLNLESRCGLKSCPNFCPTYEWNCKLLGNDLSVSDEDFPQILGKVGQKSSAKVLSEQIPPKYEYFENLDCCSLCGGVDNLEAIGNYKVCSKCIEQTNGGVNRIRIELEFGRPAREVLEFIILKWHSTTEQSRILGITTEEINSLYKIYSLNPTKYLTKNEKRFINPFNNSKRTAKNTVDEYLQRIWFRYIGYRRIQPVREEVVRLAEHLMIEANSFLVSRKLEGFKQ